MKKILYIGMNPTTLDFSQPGFEPGLTAEKVQAGIDAEIKSLREFGFETTMHFIDTGDMTLNNLAAQLKSHSYDGVLIGAGIRVPPVNLVFFETIINTVHSGAPQAKIIFNTNPRDSHQAITRWL